MKTVNLVLGCVAAAALVATGCSKSDKTPPPPQVQGVTIDIPKLDQAFANATPELKRDVTQAGFNVRYGKYEDALMVLDKVSNDTSITPDQKTAVTQVIEEVKKLANAAPAAAPAQ